MTSPPVIDIEALLVPLSADQPGGTNPRADGSATSLYYRIKDARNAARAAERGALENDGGVPEEWEQVQSVSLQLLETQAKDLEVAAWLTEALVRLEGFAGLRDGLTLIARLVDTFWDGLFPEPDDDGLETKVGPVAGLSGSGAPGTLLQPIRTLRFTRGATASYSLWHYEQAADLDKQTDQARRDARIAAGVITMAQFQQSVKETAADEIHSVFEAVEGSLAALAAMAESFRKAAGNEAPSISALRDLLSQVAGTIRFVAADKLAAASAAGEAAEAVASEAAEAGVADAPRAAGAPAPVRRTEGFASRDEALAELTKIAAYFRKTEPHSPLSYTIDEAVRRGRLSLPELLVELAQDPTHIKHILLAAGIRDVPAG